jgi:hypothetical protein
MNWFGPSGDCGCCGGVCPECDTFTSVVISDLTSCTGCTDIEGTYVVRDIGDPWLVTCSVNIVALSSGTTCSGVIVTGAGQPGSPRIIVTLSSVGGSVKCDIDFVVKYTDSVGAPTFQSEYITRFSATVATCADLVGAVFTFVSSTETGFGTLPGDVCGMESATVTLAV